MAATTRLELATSAVTATFPVIRSIVSESCVNDADAQFAGQHENPAL
jgi:hypothetical protein